MAKFVDITGRVWNAEKQVPVIEYAKKACLESPIVVGLKSKSAAVLVALSPCSDTDPLAVQQPALNLTRINDYMGSAFTGNRADALRLCNYVKDSSASSLRAFNAQHPVYRCVSAMTKITTDATLNLTKPMYVCELIVAGRDQKGLQIFELGIQSIFLDCHATALGKDNNVAREYLERNYDFLNDSSMEDLINYGITAILKTLPKEKIACGKVKVAIDVFGDCTPNKPLSAQENCDYLKKAIDRFHADEGKK